MALELQSPPSLEELSSAHRRRAPWRRRLVEAERGITQGFRGDSTLFGHLFGGTLVLAMALVLGLSVLEWAVLVLALTVVLAAELFNKVLTILCRREILVGDETLKHIASIGTAAVICTMSGSLVVVGLLFGRRLSILLGG
ncbi:MAG: diacylglycerol kinase [Planctomycetes bacterium]|nr:diacylglycerol kinase [Planctomycetota bacterium]